MNLIRTMTVLGTFGLGSAMPTVVLAQATVAEGSQGSGSFGVDPFTGQLTGTIPLEVPSGRNGLQPNLAVVYSSAAGESWLGRGWDLNPGVIERQTKFGVNYGGDDYVFRSSGVTRELVRTTGNEYRANIEQDFTRIEKITGGTPYFMATDTSGTKYFFGQQANARVAQGNNIFRWALNRVEDPDGNYMLLTYTRHRGQLYLATIRYTGNGSLPPTNTVTFQLEDRPSYDVTVGYRPNFELTTAKRLKQIDLTVNEQTSMGAYTFSYIENHDTLRPQLARIDRESADVAQRASTYVELEYRAFSGYQEEFVDESSWAFGWCAGGSHYHRGDFNGDGIEDLWCLTSGGYPGVLVSNGEDAFTDIGGQFTSAADRCDELQAGDVTGDGQSDLVCVRYQDRHLLNGIIPVYNIVYYVYVSTGSGFQGRQQWLKVSDIPEILLEHKFFQFPPNDYDGDGKLDVTMHIGFVESANTTVYRSNGTSSFTKWGSEVPWCQGQTNPDLVLTAGVTAGDFNGDGNADLLCHTLEGSNTVALSTNAGLVKQGEWLPNWCGNGDFGAKDMNGDGQGDLWCRTTTGDFEVALSTGSGFQTGLLDGDASSRCTGDLGDVGIGDFDGDGKQDMWCHDDGETTTALQYGDRFSWKMPHANSNESPRTSWCASGEMGEGDFSGDGKTDLFCHAGGTVLVARTNGTYFSGFPSTKKEASPGPTHLLRKVSRLVVSSDDHFFSYTPSTHYANTRLPYPIQVVSAIRDGEGGRTTYDYAGGFHHLADRDFRGFHSVTVTGPAGAHGEQLVTQTWFHQGNDTAVGVNNPDVLVGYTQGAPYRTTVTDGVGTLYTETTTDYTPDNNGPPFFTPPASVVTTICDGTGCDKTTQTDFTYNSHGNVTREDQYGDTSTSADDRTIVRAFDAPNTTDWLVRFPTSETIYQGLGLGTLMAHTDFYYDGTADCGTASTTQEPTAGHLTRVVRRHDQGPDSETRWAYNALGNLLCTRDANTHTTTFGYDASGTFVLTATNPLDHVTRTHYYGVESVAMDTGPYGLVKSVTDPNGAVVRTEYDGLGRPITVTQPDGFWTTTTYGGWGFLLGSTSIETDSALSLKTWRYFDDVGRQIQEKRTGTDGNIIVTDTDYDQRGAVTRRSLPYFESGGSPQWVTHDYDPLGRLLQRTNPDGTRVLACHDDWVTVTIDANEHQTRTVRDAYGRILTVQEYTGTHPTCSTGVGAPYATTTYVYDVLGNLTTVTDAQGNVSTMQYDTLSRKIAMHDPDMGEWSYEYDANGNLKIQTDAKRQQIHFQYDELNRRKQKDYGTRKALGAGDVVYTYDGSTHHRKGRLHQVHDAAGTTIFYYDNRGRTTRTDRVVAGVTYTTQTSYDGVGRVTAMTYPDHSIVTQTYNGPQLKDVKEGGVTYASYGGFNALGQPSTLTHANEVTTSYTYDPQNYRLATLTTVKGATVLQDLGYHYDPVGNVKDLTDPTHGNQTFGYDALDRLTQATGTYGTLTYTYNGIGNMTTNSRVGSYTYPPSGPNSVRPHAVTNAGGQTYLYDGNGNQLAGDGRILAYDAENRPVKITTGDSGSVPVLLTVTLAGQGEGTVISEDQGMTCTTGECEAVYFTSSVVTLTATPISGSTFAGWSGACSGLGPCQVTMDLSHTVTATFEPLPVNGDLNRDGNPDLLLRHDNGFLHLWLMNGQGTVATGVNCCWPSTEWTVIEVVDLNRDGNPDVLLRHDNGFLHLWLMDGQGTVATAVNVGVLGTDWTVVDVVDLNRDGNPDLLLRRDDGYLYLWLTNAQGTVASGVHVGGLGTEWTVVDVVDLNRDGNPDLLLRRDDGYLYLWLTNAQGTVASGVHVGGLGTEWTVVDVVDLNRDGNPDLLLRRDDGYLYLWLTNAQGTVATGVHVGPLGTDWTVVDVVDRNRDGNPDLLLRRDDGYLYLWLTNAQGTVATGVNVGGLGAEWTIQPVGDPHRPSPLTAQGRLGSMTHPEAVATLAPFRVREAEPPWAVLVSQGRGRGAHPQAAPEAQTVAAKGKGGPDKVKPGPEKKRRGLRPPVPWLEDGEKRRPPTPRAPGLKDGEKHRGPTPPAPWRKDEKKRRGPTPPVPGFRDGEKRQGPAVPGPKFKDGEHYQLPTPPVPWFDQGEEREGQSTRPPVTDAPGRMAQRERAHPGHRLTVAPSAGVGTDVPRVGERATGPVSPAPPSGLSPYLHLAEFRPQASNPPNRH